MSGQNILTGSKLCWEAIFRQGPDAILRPDEIFSMDESGVTVYGTAGCKDIVKTRKGSLPFRTRKKA